MTFYGTSWNDNRHDTNRLVSVLPSIKHTTETALHSNPAPAVTWHVVMLIMCTV